ncbi:MAG: peptidoglycan DD-metalloendopeptidase family protein [Erysipelotrichaceae bacterium]|nr:peptidoglycan DD-metalloendopeptidase family protein [Erysipelotrichaceae bacterium]
MRRLLLVILTGQIVLTCFIIPLKAEGNSWLWPLWSYDEDGQLFPISHLSTVYSDSHLALDIAPAFDLELVEVRAAKSGTVCTVYSGCNNIDGMFNDSCRNEGICDPLKEELEDYDSNGDPVIKKTENNYSTSGSVTKGYCHNGLGNTVDILHEDGTCSQYAHLDKMTVKVGDYIQQGEVIGYAGSTGYSSGRHLHFAIYPNRDDLKRRRNALNCNPDSYDYQLTADDDQDIDRNSDGYIRDKEGVSYIFEINIRTPQIALSNTSLSLLEGQTAYLRAKLLYISYGGITKFAYSSDNPSVATVDQEGVITAVSSGNARITVTFRDLTAYCDIEVLKQQETYIIHYDFNGGTGELEDQIKKAGEAAIITEYIPVREGYRFRGWGKRPKSWFVKYEWGDEYTKDKDITLYALWHKIWFYGWFGKNKDK